MGENTVGRKAEPFVPVPFGVLNERDPSLVITYTAYYRLADWKSKLGSAIWEELIHLTGLSRATLKKKRKRLEEMGYLEVERGGGRGNGSKWTIYLESRKGYPLPDLDLFPEKGSASEPVSQGNGSESDHVSDPVIIESEKKTSKGSLGRDANQILRHLVQVGLFGQSPKDWSKQNKITQNLLRGGETKESLIEAIDGMRFLWPWSDRKTPFNLQALIRKKDEARAALKQEKGQTEMDWSNPDHPDHYLFQRAQEQ